VIENNTTSSSVLGLNHDGIPSGGPEIWSWNTLIADNLTYDTGSMGVLSGGGHNVIAHNVTYDNGLASSTAAGIVLQSHLPGSLTAAVAGSGDIVAGNISCNTAPGVLPSNPRQPVCDSSSTVGQAWALYVDTWMSGPTQLGALGTIVDPDNTFASGTRSEYSVPVSDFVSEAAPQGTITVPSCLLSELVGSCSTTVQWDSSNATTAAVWVTKASNPSGWQLMGYTGGGAGSTPINWIGNNIYVFELRSDQGVLASTTVQPTRMLTATLNACAPGSAECTASYAWNAVGNVQVGIKEDIETNFVPLTGVVPSGTGVTGLWISPGHSYTFNLYTPGQCVNSICSGSPLDSVTLNEPVN
jgi:hypothetical protein